MEKPFSPYLALEIINAERSAGKKVVLFSDDVPILESLKAQSDSFIASNGGRMYSY